MINVVKNKCHQPPKLSFGNFISSGKLFTLIRRKKSPQLFKCSHAPPSYVVTYWWSSTDGAKVPGLSLWNPEIWPQQILSRKAAYCAVTALSILFWLMMNSFILEMQNASHVSGNKKYVFLWLNIIHFIPCNKQSPLWCSEAWLNW